MAVLFILERCETRDSIGLFAWDLGVLILQNSPNYSCRPWTVLKVKSTELASILSIVWTRQKYRQTIELKVV